MVSFLFRIHWLVLIPLVLALILRAPVWLLAASVALVALLTARELLGITEHYGVQPMRRPTYVFIVLIFVFLAIVLSAQTQVMDIGGALLKRFCRGLSQRKPVCTGKRTVQIEIVSQNSAGRQFER